MVKKITTTELRQGKINGGIIFQGCAEPNEDWVNGVNEMLTDEGILLEGTKYKPDDVYSFEHEGITNLVFPFEPVKLDIGKLAMWRLATHGTFSAKWVEDYVDNRLGGPLRKDEPEQKKKPDCALIGQDGNIFNLMGIASRTLRKHGLADQAKEMCDRIYESDSYDKALCIIGEYVNITSVDDGEGEGEGIGSGLSPDDEEPEEDYGMEM